MQKRIMSKHDERLLNNDYREKTKGSRNMKKVQVDIRSVAIMEVFDNVSKIVKDDLEVELKKNSRLSIAAAYFSIYAFQQLKDQLEGINELRFIFTSPTFLTEKAEKEKVQALHKPDGNKVSDA